jgi:hypothetical protein
MVFKNEEYDGIALYSCANYLYIHVVWSFHEEAQSIEKL